MAVLNRMPLATRAGVCLIVGALLGLALRAVLGLPMEGTFELPFTHQASASACVAGGHQLAEGTIIKADAGGETWTVNSTVPVPVTELLCTAGTWIPLPAGTAPVKAHTAALVRPAAAPGLPGWVKWQRAPRGAEREVCGTRHGHVVPGIIITVSSDSSVLVCANGRSAAS